MEQEKKFDGDEEYVPLVIWGARLAREKCDYLWRYVSMNFVPIILLFAATAMAYRMVAQSCR